MNTSKLAKHYGSLSVVERLRMTHDALRRSDDVEIRNLRNAAPYRYSMTDVSRFEGHLRQLATFRYCEQVEIAAEFWHAQTQARWAFDEWIEATKLDPDAAGDLEHEREFRYWSCIVKCTEYRYILERDGWDLFTKQSGFDVSRIDLMPRSWLIEYMDENAAVHSDTADALQWLKKRDDPIKLRTAEDVAADWHEAVHRLANGELN